MVGIYYKQTLQVHNWCTLPSLWSWKRSSEGVMFRLKSKEGIEVGQVMGSGEGKEGCGAA